MWLDINKIWRKFVDSYGNPVAFVTFELKLSKNVNVLICTTAFFGVVYRCRGSWPDSAGGIYSFDGHRAVLDRIA